MSGHVSHKNINESNFQLVLLVRARVAGKVYAGKLNKKNIEHLYFYQMESVMKDLPGKHYVCKPFQLKNLIAIVDYNKLQSIKSTEETMKLEPFVDK